MQKCRWLALVALALAPLGSTQAACCYFSAKNADILQPAQKVFLSYDPAEKVETFTVQPKFEGNALDFGMVIPTPSQPKLHEMPKEFFKIAMSAAVTSSPPSAVDTTSSLAVPPWVARNAHFRPATVGLPTDRFATPTRSASGSSDTARATSL